MFLKQIDLTTALRPLYLPDEVLLFVQDNVGLYEGKYKLPKQQNGQVYLTSHRICYVDKDDPRAQSVALDLKDVERFEFYAGFLKSSAKITLFPKPAKRSSLQTRASAVAGLGPSRSGAGSPLQRSDTPTEAPLPPPTAATWVCTICSFSNSVPSNFDPTTANAHTPLPPCLACGIKPALTHVLKASIANAANRHATPGPVLQTPLPIHPRPVSEPPAPSGAAAAAVDITAQTPAPLDDASFQCPRCTFLNHPSLLSCEICGAPLISQNLPAELTQGGSNQVRGGTASPGPVLNMPLLQTLDNPDCVKISFRGGGEKIFHERLKGATTQRKWLLQGAPPIPRPGDATSSSGSGSGNAGGVGAGVGASPGGERTTKIAGIAGLEHRGQALRKNNELMIGSAFEDLEALMASAKEIVALAEDFARQVGSGNGSGNGSGSGSSASENALLAESASQLGLITTRDIVGSSRGSSGDDNSLYLSELARNLAEFLTDDARGVLRRAGGIVTLVDLWAVFNRARGGVELVSPLDMAKAAALWETLRLPVRLRTFKSGVMVVQARDRTDDTTIRAITAWLRDLHASPPPTARLATWDWQMFGRGVTAQDAAERFGWSIGVAEAELEMAEERGVLCREEDIEGLKFWENYIDTGEGRLRKKTQAQDERDRVVRALRETGMI